MYHVFKFQESQINIKVSRTLMSFMALLLGLQRSMEVPDWSFIASKVHRWFRNVPKNLSLKNLPSMINIRVSRTLLSFMSSLLRVLKDTGVSWMGFPNRKVLGWLRNVPMYLCFKFQLSRITIKVSRTKFPVS